MCRISHLCGCCYDQYLFDTYNYVRGITGSHREAAWSKSDRILLLILCRPIQLCQKSEQGGPPSVDGIKFFFLDPKIRINLEQHSGQSFGSSSHVEGYTSFSQLITFWSFLIRSLRAKWRGYLLWSLLIIIPSVTSICITHVRLSCPVLFNKLYLSYFLLAIRSKDVRLCVCLIAVI